MALREMDKKSFLCHHLLKIIALPNENQFGVGTTGEFAFLYPYI